MVITYKKLIEEAQTEMFYYLIQENIGIVDG